MNSSEVAKHLGVSTSTVQRWVKQLNLPMERNERGHYTFKEADLPLLEEIRDKIQSGALLQDIAPFKDPSPRKGTVKAVEIHPDVEELLMKFNDMERRLDGKADSVTSYQLLQHRREIEELQKTVAELAATITTLQSQAQTKKDSSIKDAPLVFDTGVPVKRKKKRNFFTLFFGF
ncbi:MerR family transcriptional regulator [Bacillus sp. EB01]|uniref:MerR family transcriptional regulator n=1 Tax=Bacillus sp. EB01 TaxID=1347086 RepID=UPI0005C61175|nr:MerR family transcriptional regulator [Bacillus sp. EB01]